MTNCASESDPRIYSEFHIFVSFDCTYVLHCERLSVSDITCCSSVSVFTYKEIPPKEKLNLVRWTQTRKPDLCFDVLTAQIEMVEEGKIYKNRTDTVT